LLAPDRKYFEDSTRNKERNREMNDHRMLCVSGEERGLQIEGIRGRCKEWFHDRRKAAAIRSLLLHHNDRPSHLRVNRAKVAISAGSACCDGELLIRIERGRFLELLLDAYYGVRFFVPIDPGHLLSRLHRYRLGIEGEVFDFYSVLLGAVGVLHFASESEERQIEKSNAAQQCRHFIFGSECNHIIEWW
jgi:hypothetical protein